VTTNVKIFFALAAVCSVIGYRFGKCYQIDFQRVLFSLLFGVTTTCAVMAIITAIGYIPDDWSANRLTWSGGLFYGYPLYPGEKGPSNGFFYPPLGAWFYLPSAGLGILLRSPTVGLVIGWCMSLGCVFTPIAFLAYLIRKYHNVSLMATFLSLTIAISIVFASQPLRYVATMIHVDAPSLLFLGLSIILALPLGSIAGKFALRRFQWAGCCISLAAFSKQSVWPLLPLIIVSIAILHGHHNAINAIKYAIISSLVLLTLMLLFENGSEAFRMICQLPSHQLIATSALAAIKQFSLSSIPFFTLMMILFAGAICKCPLDPMLKKSAAVFFLFAFWMIPFAIMTRMRIGADSNHLAIPLFLALLGVMTLLPPMLSDLFHSQVTFVAALISLGISVLLVVSLTPYLEQYCGWFLWSHNSQEQALYYELSHNKRAYFPWQIYSMLLAEGKLYHLDDCLRYEASAGWKRSDDSYRRFLPDEPFLIAIRPFGARSYVAQEEGYHEVAPSPSLQGWNIYQRNP
jgi:hypothetical protein